MTPLIIIVCYLVLLLLLGVFSSRFFRGTSKDFFVASNSIGPFFLLMSVFGTTMTGFALVGSTTKSFERGIGAYGLMASASSLIHAAVFFLIGIRLWAYGKKHGYVTQIQFFRDRFESDKIGYLLFPILVGMVLPYLLIGVLAAGKVVQPVTAGAFPEIFSTPGPFQGGIPMWLTGLVVCTVVLTYVFCGGSRGTVWANTFQTIVFMIMGVLAFILISGTLGGPSKAAEIGLQINADGQAIRTHVVDKKTRKLKKLPKPIVVGQLAEKTEHQKEAAKTLKADIAANGNIYPHQTRRVVEVEYKVFSPKTKKPVPVMDQATGKPKLTPDGKPIVKKFVREHGVPPLMFLTYLFIPLSVGMFPHLFQNWLTAKSAKTFRLTVVAHPIFIMIVWVPCILIGMWASGVLPPLPPAKTGAVLGLMVKTMTGDPIIVGLVGAGVLAAIMSSLDSQFLCVGTIFTNDIVLHRVGKDRFTDKQIVLIARGFIIAIVIITYILAMIANSAGANIFDLAVWCFSGFSGLFPLVFAAVFWRRATKAGAYATIIASMGTWAVFFHLSGYGGEYTIWGGVMPAALCFAAGAIALVGVSLVTQPPSDATLEKFFPTRESSEQATS